MWWPIRSKRKPSTRYSRTHVRSESSISFSIIRCSLAVFAQQVELSTHPFGASRW